MAISILLSSFNYRTSSLRTIPCSLYLGVLGAFVTEKKLRSGFVGDDVEILSLLFCIDNIPNFNVEGSRGLGLVVRAIGILGATAVTSMTCILSWWKSLFNVLGNGNVFGVYFWVGGTWTSRVGSWC